MNYSDKILNMLVAAFGFGKEEEEAEEETVVCTVQSDVQAEPTQTTLPDK